MSEADTLDQRAAILQGAGDKLLALQRTLNTWASRLTTSANITLSSWHGKAATGAKTKYRQLAQACTDVAQGLQSTINAYFDAAKQLRKAARSMRVMTWLNPILITLDVVLTIATAFFAPGLGSIIGKAFSFLGRAIANVATRVSPRAAAAVGRAAGNTVYAVKHSRAWLACRGVPLRAQRMANARGVAFPRLPLPSRPAVRPTAGRGSTPSGWGHLVPGPRDLASLGWEGSTQFAQNYGLGLTNQGISHAAAGTSMDYGGAAKWAAAGTLGGIVLPAAKLNRAARNRWTSAAPTPFGRATDDAVLDGAAGAGIGQATTAALAPAIAPGWEDDPQRLWGLLGFGTGALAGAGKALRAGAKPDAQMPYQHSGQQPGGRPVAPPPAGTGGPTPAWTYAGGGPSNNRFRGRPGASPDRRPTSEANPRFAGGRPRDVAPRIDEAVQPGSGAAPRYGPVTRRPVERLPRIPESRGSGAAGDRGWRPPMEKPVRTGEGWTHEKVWTDKELRESFYPAGETGPGAVHSSVPPASARGDGTPLPHWPVKPPSLEGPKPPTSKRGQVSDLFETPSTHWFPRPTPRPFDSRPTADGRPGEKSWADLVGALTAALPSAVAGARLVPEIKREEDAADGHTVDGDDSRWTVEPGEEADQR